MDVREKLVELIRCADYHPCRGAARTIGSMFTTDFIEDIASHLIAHGVTVQDNTEISDELLKQLRNAPLTVLHEEPTIELVQEWISVKDERKPKQLQECLCVCQFEDDTKGEWRFYNVLKWHDVPYQDNGIVNRPHFTDEGVHGMVVTHWMPLPKLPQPPEGE